MMRRFVIVPLAFAAMSMANMFAMQPVAPQPDTGKVAKELLKAAELQKAPRPDAVPRPGVPGAVVPGVAATALDMLRDEVLRNLTVTGDLHIDGHIFTSSSAIDHVLYVHKGTLTGPDQFSSVNAALASITDNGLYSRYVIKIAPGVYYETPITLKSYVALVGDSQLTSIIEASLDSATIMIGADQSSVEGLTLRHNPGHGVSAGSIALDFSNVAGQMNVSNCYFGKSDELIKMATATATQSGFIEITNMEIASDSGFSKAFNITNVGVSTAVGMLVNGLYWGSPNPMVTSAQVVHAEYTGAFFYGNNINVGSLTYTPAAGTNFLYLARGAAARIENSSINGFTTAITVPVVGAAPSLTLWAVNAANNTTDINVAETGTTGAISGQFTSSGAVTLGASVLSRGASSLTLGKDSQTSGNSSIAMGNAARATENYGTAIGRLAYATSGNAIAIGYGASGNATNVIALGTNAQATTTAGAMALGYNALASGGSGVALGAGAQSTAANAIAIGNIAAGSGTSSIALGNGASATANYGVAMGYTAQATSENSVAIGNNAQATTAANATALGNNALATGASGVALGAGAQVTLGSSVAIGDSASTAGGIGAIAIGKRSIASYDYNIAIGGGISTSNTISDGDSSIAIGSETRAAGVQSIAIGYQAESSGSKGIAMGPSAGVESIAWHGIAIGYSAHSKSSGAISIGGSASTTGTYSIALGYSAVAKADYATAIGYSSSASGDNSVAMGRDAHVSGAGAIAIGYSAVSSGNSAIAFGRSSQATADNGIAIGQSTLANSSSGIALGYAAQSTAGNAIAIGNMATGSGTSSVALGDSASATTTGAIAIGNLARATSGYAIALGAGAASTTGKAMFVGGATTTNSIEDIFYNRAAGTTGTCHVVGASLAQPGPVQVIFGACSTGGTALGYGFTAAHPSLGRIVITFDKPFPIAPAVVVSGLNASVATDGLATQLYTAPTTTGFWTYSAATAGAADIPIYFTAIGQIATS